MRREKKEKELAFTGMQVRVNVQKTREEKRRDTGKMKKIGAEQQARLSAYGEKIC